jgi:hypothetical protein
MGLKPYDKSTINEILLEHTNLTNCIKELDDWIMKLKEVVEETLSDDAQVQVANILEKHDCYKLVRGA